MEAADDGRAVRAGTYCANPVAMPAVMATLSRLRECDYDEDQKPAVDVGKSVSRVGGKTLLQVLKAAFRESAP
ncbi:hypothetical protein [Mesorhizobium sp. LNJC391B00]|uniref:hypothetical protein n=1 Tax=Mesorhizobium sp. LNJC391B00 TaxID=1287273 RepID=UPI0003CE44DB|nr:hypothetical protein [Mesorhizobium sp. LNJC391B00]ESY17748.1 hypothetical protein X749_30565 [Mesorhizobium sp. LNJC391B00]